MSDLNMMMRTQALAGLNGQLDVAVTNGDAEGARKIAADIAKLEVSTAPKAPPFGQADITAELDKQPWFGTDPRKSRTAVDLGKTMDPRKFPTAAAFAEALVKAVEEEFKPVAAAENDPAEDETDEERDAREAKEAEAAAKTAAKLRRTDGPGDRDALGAGTGTRQSSGPWAKLPDAPAAVQKEIKRQADKFVSSNAPKEQREKFIAHALGSHYTAHLRAKGKK